MIQAPSPLGASAETSLSRGARAPLWRAGGPIVATGALTPHRLETGRLVAISSDLAPNQAAIAAEGAGHTLYNAVATDRVVAQALQCLANLDTVLRAAGSNTSRVVLLRIFLRHAHDRPAVARTIRAWFGDSIPAGEIVITGNQGCDPAQLLHLDALAAPISSPWTPRPGVAMELRAITDPFPTQITYGPYVFTSGMPGVLDATGRLPTTQTDLPAPERALLREIGDIPAGILPFLLQQAALWALGRQVLAAAGTTAERIFHHLAWLGVNMRELANGSITRRVTPLVGDYALTCFPVFGFHRPGSLIEGRFAALLPDLGVDKTARVPLHGISNSYVGAIEVGSLVFGAGEVPVDTAARRVVTQPGDDASHAHAAFGLVAPQAATVVQAAYIYDLIGKTLAAHGLSPADVLQQTLYLADVADQAVVELMAHSFFGAAGPPPTAIAPILGASPFPQTRLEIEFVAAGRG